VFPLTAILGVKRQVKGTKTVRGNAAVTFAAAADWPVYGYGPGANIEPGLPNRDTSEILWTVFAPVDEFAPTEHDRVVLDGDEYAVAGRPQDFSRGPFGYGAGLVVELKRTE
jgi:hypothetical protein